MGPVLGLFLFGSLLAFSMITGRVRCTRYIGLAIGLPMLTTWPLAKLFTYYRLTLPTWLTLGYLVDFGGFMPASCEVSMPVEGPCGVPCGLLSLRSWLVKVFAGPDRWDSFVQPEPVVMICLVLGTMWLVSLVAISFTPRRIDRENEKARLEKCERECEDRKLEAGTPIRL